MLGQRAELLEQIGTRELVRYLLNADYTDVMSRGRFAASEALRQRIQARADSPAPGQPPLGVGIVFVGMQDIHPPVKVAAAYEAVLGARHKREAALLSAAAYRAQTNALATAEAVRRKRQAEADSQRGQVGALARAALYTNQMAAFKASPDVYSRRAYLQTLVRHGAGARKYVLATTNAQEVLQYNLEEKLSEYDILKVGIPPAKPK